MPPKGRARGAGPSASSSGAASSSPSLLLGELREAFADLPRLVRTLTAGASSSGRGGGLSALLDLTRQMSILEEIPLDSPPHAAAMAELLSSQPDSAKALLRLHAAALREGGNWEGAGGGGSGGGSGGGGRWEELWPPIARSVAARVVCLCAPLPASRHALTVLRFVRATLRAQPLHAISQQLAAAAAVLEASGGSGGASGASAAAVAQAATDRARGVVAMLPCFLALSATRLLLCDNAFAGLLFPKDGAGAPTHIAPPPELAAAVAAERAAGVEELARGLAESGVLEHAARVLLLLQARGPQAVRPREDTDHTLPEEVVRILNAFVWHASGRGGDPCLAVFRPEGAQIACPPCVSPSAAALLRSALSGRCVQTAVLVYGVGTLRLVDRGPTYGLPAALQTAGLAMCGVGKRSPNPLVLALLLRQLASRTALLPPGPGGRLELALRVCRTAVGSLAVQELSSAAPSSSSDGPFHPPPAVAVPLNAEPRLSALLLAVAALHCSRGLLPDCDTTAWQAEQREKWWLLAVGALVKGSDILAGEGESLQRLLDLVTEPLLKDCTGVDAVRLELAAALEGGLLSMLAVLFASAHRYQRSNGHFTTAVFAACDRAASRDDGLGFAMLVTPLLAYGSTEEATLLLDAMGVLGGLLEGGKAERSVRLQDPTYVRAAAAISESDREPVRKAAASLLTFAATELETYEFWLTGAPPAEEGAAAAGSSVSAPGAAAAATAAAASTGDSSAGVDVSPGEQLRELLSYASDLWGLPLPPPLASAH
ncbi:hypothetical protein HYH03_009440 [Edaphochlamys debaryana]|uniref:Uncharacterized protein n=1 Tax=Edaphochlamys debaryana TaxID=47281 RepID=A0A836BYD6_9CHLO|nr:hypothetical protein HYH03_009440 [Edaphochlamys debaryana]|eukprot:KAG2492193.1 hypothetical protein HYH03_009440 [Edaphochlamys debaryana]